MTTKYSLENIKNIYNSHGLEFLENEYKKNKIPYKTKCLKCEYIWKITLNDVKRGHGCPRCAGLAKPSFEKVKQIYSDNNLELLETKYKNYIFTNQTKCLKCDYIWKISFSDVKGGHGCPRCAGNAKIELEEAKKIYLEHNLEFLEKTYKSSTFPHEVKCLECKNIWNTSLSNIKNYHNCPFCSKGKNEKFTGEILKTLFPSIEIKPKTFHIEIFDENNLKIRDKFIVDFYFQHNDKEYIIEYNGIQHFKPTIFGSVTQEKSELNFKNQQIRDEFVRNYCKENDINLLEIDGRKYKNNDIKIMI